MTGCDRCKDKPATRHVEWRDGGDDASWPNRTTERCDGCTEALHDYARVINHGRTDEHALRILIDRPLDGVKPPRPRKLAGRRASHWNAQRGTWVSVYDGEAQQMDTDAGRWQVVCERHGTVLSDDTLAQAKQDARHDPAEFCEECRDPGYLELPA